MNHIINDMTAYNDWANDRVCSFILKADEKLIDQPLKSSFPTIRKTLMHIWSAESVWLSRLKGNSPDHFPADRFTGAREELVSQLKQTSSGFIGYALKQDILSLEKVVDYTNTRHIPFHNKVYEIIMQCMNHSTYHRGQLITMLREVGYTDITTLDLITFYRERK